MTKGEGGQKSQKIDDFFMNGPYHEIGCIQYFQIIGIDIFIIDFY